MSIKVTDFGLARRIQGNRRYGKLVGTQTQWSPEKAKVTMATATIANIEDQVQYRF